MKSVNFSIALVASIGSAASRSATSLATRARPGRRRSHPVRSGTARWKYPSRRCRPRPRRSAAICSAPSSRSAQSCRRCRCDSRWCSSRSARARRDRRCPGTAWPRTFNPSPCAMVVVRNGFDQPQPERRRGDAEDQVVPRGLCVEVLLRNLTVDRRIAAPCNHEKVVHAAVARHTVCLVLESGLARRAVRLSRRTVLGSALPPLSPSRLRD